MIHPLILWQLARQPRGSGVQPPRPRRSPRSRRPLRRALGRPGRLEVTDDAVAPGPSPARFPSTSRPH